jgi:anoctamin-10
MHETIQTIGDKELKKLFTEMEDEAESTDFDAESVDEEAAFNFKVPWGIPTDTMRDYFGEKIALYFDFLSFYTKQLWYMAVLAIIAEIMMRHASSDARNSVVVVFSIIIIMWSTLFLEFWKRE